MFEFFYPKQGEMTAEEREREPSSAEVENGSKLQARASDKGCVPKRAFQTIKEVTKDKEQS